MTEPAKAKWKAAQDAKAAATAKAKAKVQAASLKAAEEYEKLKAKVDDLGLDIAFAHFRTYHEAVTCIGQGPRLPIPFIRMHTFRYFRTAGGDRVSDWEPGPRGGGTRCRIYDPDGDIIAEYYEKCSMDDAFVYQKGRALSLEQAVKVLFE